GDRAAVDLRDHIERTQIAFVRWRVGFNRAHDHAFIEPFEQLADRLIVTQSLDPNPEPRPDDALSGDQLLADLVREVDRDRETETAIQSVDQRVHADHSPVDVAQWTAAVARIDRRVRLQVIRDRVAAGRDQFAPAFPADDAVGERVIELERRAYSERELTHAHRIAVADLHRRQILRLDLDHRDVCLLIAAHELRGKLAAVLQLHLNLIRAFDDVEIGQDVSVA